MSGNPNDELFLNQCRQNPSFGNDGWDDSCGKGAPPRYMSTKLDKNLTMEGNWVEERRLDDNIVSRRHISLYKRRVDYGPLVAIPSKKDREGPWFYSIRDGWEYDNYKRVVRSSGDGTCTIDYNGKLSFVTRLRSTILNRTGPDEMVGTWTIDDNWHGRHEKGTVTSRRIYPKINCIKYLGDKIDEVVIQRGRGTGRRLGVLEFKYQGGGAVNPRANRRNVYIEVYGENLWGFHRVWIDKCDNFEYGGSSYITREAKTENENLYSLSDNIIGIRLKFVTWQGMFPGIKTLYIDDLPIPFKLVLNEYPENNLPIAKQLNQARNYISDIYPDNKVRIRFFSTIGVYGEENPIEKEGESRFKADYYFKANLRVLQPFWIEVEFQDDIDIDSGWIALEKDSKFIGRVRINKFGDSKKKFMSSSIVLIYEHSGNEDTFQIDEVQTKSKLRARTSALSPDLISGETCEDAELLPPFPPETGSITVQINGWIDKPMSKHDVGEGIVTLHGSGTPILLEKQLDDAQTRFGRDLPTGLYTLKLEFRGSVIEGPQVEITERGHQRVEIGGSKELGVINYRSRSLDDVIGLIGYGRGNAQKVFSRGGKEIYRNAIDSSAQLPKGEYELSIDEMILPESFPVTVKPGKYNDIEPNFGVLRVRSRDYDNNVRGRNYQSVVQVKKDDRSSPEKTFFKDVSLILPAGTFTLEFHEKGKNEKHSAVIEIYPGKLTSYSVGRVLTPGDSVIYDDSDLPGLDEIGETDTDSTSTDSTESIEEKTGNDLPIDEPVKAIEEPPEDKDVDNVPSFGSDDSVISEKEELSYAESEHLARARRLHEAKAKAETRYDARMIGDILLDDNKESMVDYYRDNPHTIRAGTHPLFRAGAPLEDDSPPPKPESIPPSTDSSDDDESVVPELTPSTTNALKEKPSRARDDSSPIKSDNVLSEKEELRALENEKQALEHRYYDDPLGSDAMWAPESASKVGDILLNDDEESAKEIDDRPFGYPHMTASAPPEDDSPPPKPEPDPPSTYSSKDDKSVAPELSSEVTIALKDKTSDETEESLEDETKKKIV